MDSKIIVYTDGAARGNPGPSASGFIIIKDGKQIKEDFHFNGTKTNNQAEYNAVIRALEWCAKNFPSCSIRICSDSELVVKQLRGEYKIRASGLIPMKKKVLGMLSKFNSVELCNLPREDKNIVQVDRGLNRLLDKLEKEKAPVKKQQALSF